MENILYLLFTWKHNYYRYWNCKLTTMAASFTCSHAKNSDSWDEGGDVLHVAVAVRVLVGSLLSRFLDPVSQNNLKNKYYIKLLKQYLGLD